MVCQLPVLFVISYYYSKARIALNGPEVIEQEAGVREFDSSDKDLIWDTLGTRQRVKTGIADELVEDDVETIRTSISEAIDQKKDAHRTDKADFYLTLLDKIDFSKPLTTEEYRKIFNETKAEKHEIPETVASDTPGDKSRGRLWFEN